MRRADPIIGWGLVLLACGVYALVCVMCASSQAEPDPALLLARTCVSERGWSLASTDCRAIGEIVEGRVAAVYGHLPRAAGWRAVIRDLSPHLHGDGPIRRPWIRSLDPSGARPAGWPGGRWSCRGGAECRVERRADWLATLDEARAIYAGTAARVCAEPPLAWGSDADLRRRLPIARDRGLTWREVDCGGTRNHFGRWVRR